MWHKKCLHNSQGQRRLSLPGYTSAYFSYFCKTPTGCTPVERVFTIYRSTWFYVCIIIFLLGCYYSRLRVQANAHFSLIDRSSHIWKVWSTRRNVCIIDTDTMFTPILLFILPKMCLLDHLQIFMYVLFYNNAYVCHTLLVLYQSNTSYRYFSPQRWGI